MLNVSNATGLGTEQTCLLTTSSIVQISRTPRPLTYVLTSFTTNVDLTFNPRVRGSGVIGVVEVSLRYANRNLVRAATTVPDRD